MAAEFGSVSYGHALRALHAGVPIEGAPPQIAAQLQRRLPVAAAGSAYAWVRFHDGLPDSAGAATAAGCDEAFVIEAGEGIDIYSESQGGWRFAVESLLRRMRAGLLPAMRMEASPLCPVRGVKLLLPPTGAVDEFKRFVNFLAARRFNTIMLELGGAMAYRRHPEINEGWIAYCAEMREYPGKTTKIQSAYGWWKNSIHADNGGGSVLDQATVRELARHCRERGMEVIPEVPLLSHADYLLTRHPELAERREDPYPDTYCPSNPATYALVFDVLEEVLDVFQPAVVNIGHDEYYSIGLCDRCKGRPAPEVFAGDIMRLHDFLAARGVRTQMWGEKLIEARFKDGTPLGGAERPGIPATHPAIEMIPRDVEILHWYWGIDRRYEDEYLRRGLAITYGNFEASGFPEWASRIRQEGVRGVVISNWGATDAITLQRNGILFETALAARLCWNPQLGDDDFDRLRCDVFRELYRGGYAEVAGAETTHALEIIHTTDHHQDYRWLVDGDYYRAEDFLLGEYLIRFADGREDRAPVIYGTNIGSDCVSWARTEDANCDAYAIDRRLREVAGAALPFREGDTTWYATRLPISRPSAPVCSVEFIPRAGFGGRVRIRDCRLVDSRVVSGVTWA